MSSNDLNIQPHSLESEQALLGSVLQDKSCLDDIIPMINGQEFYKISHLHIYRAIVELAMMGENVDTVTVVNRLKETKKLEECGGAYYITGLVESVPTVANAKNYARIVWDNYMLRQIILAGHDMIKSAYENTESPTEALISAEKLIFQLSEHSDKSDFSPVSASMNKVVDKIDLMMAERGAVIGVKTGLIDLDKQIGGFQKGNLVILAGRPSMGKTAMALNITRNSGVPVAFFSLEMTQEELASRLLFTDAGVDSQKARNGFMSNKDVDELMKKVDVINELPIYTDDSVDTQISNLRSKARRIITQKNIELIVIDYLQLIDGRGDTRNQELSTITRSLKNMAKELQVPVILLSQLSRNCEFRNNKRPRLSDLRDSGAIEQDADIVIFLYRDGYYQKLEGQAPENNIAECNIAKNRNGATGMVRVIFREEITKFDNYTEGFEEEVVPF